MARIRILPPEASRLIAAGEVIDRPAAALRELIDNAIDAGASEIRVEMRGGGIDSLSVSDDGCGMSKEDLQLSVLDHATSKIESADDLLSARTLGFRGEALASIAAVARIDIVSMETSGEVGWRLEKEPGKEASLSPLAARQGTKVTVRGIFERFPARRQFLKRPAAEGALCRQIFIERAIAHPSLAFVWDSGAESEHLPAMSFEERIALLYPEIPGRLLARFETEAGGASLKAVYADPSFHRKDRKYLQVFVNRRRVPEWGFVGLLEYLFSEYLPGGMKPCAFLFVEIDPSQADFNIHPAKREVRIKNPEPIRSAFYASFKAHLRAALGSGPTDLSFRPGAETPFPDFFPRQGVPGARGGAERAFWDKLTEARKTEDGSWAQESPAPPFRYLGRAFGPFLLFEKDEELFVLDQHAAHERILYDELSGAKSASQSLLVPFIFECGEKDEARRMKAALPELARMGYEIEVSSGDSFTVNGVPAFLGEKGIQALVDCFSSELPKEEAAKDIISLMACRAAVKDGDLLDDFAARNLIERALALPFPRCPHGRPIWVKFDKTTLYRMVGRITS